jgi:polyhydroxyalkanoate synthesis regulator phasin
MTIDRGLINRIRARGEEVFGQISGELMSNPRFMKAMEGAMRGREKVEEAVGAALKQMNVPSRSELKRALGRIDGLEREVSALRAELKKRAAAEKAARTKAKAAAGRKAAARPKPGTPAA